MTVIELYANALTENFTLKEKLSHEQSANAAMRSERNTLHKELVCERNEVDSLRETLVKERAEIARLNGVVKRLQQHLDTCAKERYERWHAEYTHISASEVARLKYDLHAAQMAWKGVREKLDSAVRQVEAEHIKNCALHTQRDDAEKAVCRLYKELDEVRSLLRVAQAVNRITAWNRRREGFNRNIDNQKATDDSKTTPCC